MRFGRRRRCGGVLGLVLFPGARALCLGGLVMWRGVLVTGLGVRALFECWGVLVAVSCFGGGGWLTFLVRLGFVLLGFSVVGGCSGAATALHE